MSIEKFTPGEWRAEFTKVFLPDGRKIHTPGWRNGDDFDVQKANAALIAAAPEMYRNEQANLEIIKRMWKVYKEFQDLQENDPDVQAVIPNLPVDAMAEVVRYLEERIIYTEQLLKKARGEE